MVVDPSRWKRFVPERPLVSRFFKYLFLLAVLALTLRVVFDAFSYYLARRSLDTEIETNKKIGSLEYLIVLQQRQRALVIDTLKARCLERKELAIYRILDAELSKQLDDAY